MVTLNSILDSAANAFGSAITSAVSPSTTKSTLPQSAGSSSLQASLKAKSLLPEYACFIVCDDRKIYVSAALPDQFSLGFSSDYDRPFADSLSGVASALKGIPKLIGYQPLVQALTARFWSGSSSQAIQIPITLQALTDEVQDVLIPLADLTSLALPSAPNGIGSIMRSPGPSFSIAKTVAAGKSIVSGTADASSSILSGLSSGISNFASKLVGDLKDGLSTGAVTSALSSLETSSTNTFNALENSIKNKISIQLGNYMIFDNVVIRDVSQVHHIQPVGGLYGSSTGNMQRVDVNLTFEPFFDVTIESIQKMFLDPTLRQHMQTALGK